MPSSYGFVHLKRRLGMIAGHPPGGCPQLTPGSVNASASAVSVLQPPCAASTRELRGLAVIPLITISCIKRYR